MVSREVECHRSTFDSTNRLPLQNLEELVAEFGTTQHFSGAEHLRPGILRRLTSVCRSTASTLGTVAREALIFSAAELTSMSEGVSRHI